MDAIMPALLAAGVLASAGAAWFVAHRRGAPAGLVLAECGAVIAAGAAMGQIPTVDRVDIAALETCRTAAIDGEVVSCE